MLTDQLSRGCSGQSVHHHRAVLRTALDVAMRWGLVSHKPIDPCVESYTKHSWSGPEARRAAILSPGHRSGLVESGTVRPERPRSPADRGQPNGAGIPALQAGPVSGASCPAQRAGLMEHGPMGRPAGGRALKEHDQVVLTAGLPEDGLLTSDVGVIVHTHRQGKALEIEFLALDATLATSLAWRPSQVRPVTAMDISHARLAGTLLYSVVFNPKLVLNWPMGFPCGLRRSRRSRRTSRNASVGTSRLAIGSPASRRPSRVSAPNNGGAPSSPKTTILVAWFPATRMTVSPTCCSTVLPSARRNLTVRRGETPMCRRMAPGTTVKLAPVSTTASTDAKRVPEGLPTSIGTRKTPISHLLARPRFCRRQAHPSVVSRKCRDVLSAL